MILKDSAILNENNIEKGDKFKAVVVKSTYIIEVKNGKLHKIKIYCFIPRPLNKSTSFFLIKKDSISKNKKGRGTNVDYSKSIKIL